GKKSSKNFITPAGGMKGAVLLLGAGPGSSLFFCILSLYQIPAGMQGLGISGNQGRRVPGK
ncbi:hypothetical protein D7X33_02665, partial [Butyricicoccus sp. 1XD8-22]